MSVEPCLRVPIRDPIPSRTLRHFLFRDAVAGESAGDVIRWWETRRIGYNAVVGSVGVVTLLFVGVLNVIGPHTHSTLAPPPLAIVAYGVLANLFYTLGWMIELSVLRPLFGRKAPIVGATLFRYGLAFASGLTLLPNLVACADLVVRLATVFTGSR